MNKKIIKICFIVLVSLNAVLLLTGIVIPWIISTDKLPLTFIVMAVTTIILAIISVVCIAIHHKLKGLNNEIQRSNGTATEGKPSNETSLDR